MEEKLEAASRWLTAMAVMLIPLSMIAIVSGAWGLNYQFDTGQWTRYLLFASWITLAVSVIAGLANLVSPSEEKAPGVEPEVRAEGSMPDMEDAEEGEEQPITPTREAFNVGYAFLLGQACTFALGVILYVTYISWLILGLQPYPSMPGF